MRTYFIADLNKAQVKNLERDKNVVVVYEKPVVTSPYDLEPTTPSFVNKQGYLDYFNIKYGWNYPGGAGENITIVDVEDGWILDHEDFSFNPYIYDNNGNSLSREDLVTVEKNKSHGTAVLGILGAEANNYGVTGVASFASIKIAVRKPNVGSAILRVLPALRGDIILIETQAKGPNHTNSQVGMIPVELYDSEFNAIKTATANNIIVVEPAGNGSQDLDSSTYSTCDANGLNRGTSYSGYPCFDVRTRDSGAIIVGASRYTSRGPNENTNRGSRIDISAWGENIVTTGYGTLFLPQVNRVSDLRQAYMRTFGGTSGASPIISGIIAQIQGRYKVLHNNRVLTPIGMRGLLKDERYSYESYGNIGRQPDVKLIFDGYLKETTQPNRCGKGVCNNKEECVLVDNVPTCRRIAGTGNPPKKM